MTQTVNVRRMETMKISFPKEDLKRLKGIAKAMGWTLDKSEDTGRMEELSDEECWEYLCATRPEGQEVLSEEENEKELDWLGIVR